MISDVALSMKSPPLKRDGDRTGLCTIEFADRNDAILLVYTLVPIFVSIVFARQKRYLGYDEESAIINYHVLSDMSAKDYSGILVYPR
jgi:hypothetical protein